MTIRVERILTSVVDQALERTLVVKILPEDEGGVCSSVDDNESDALRCLIQVCGGGCYRFNRKHDEEHIRGVKINRYVSISVFSV